jgi:hypothetical protein
VSSLGDAESSLGDAESSLGDAKRLLADAVSSLGDAKRSLATLRARWVTLRARWVKLGARTRAQRLAWCGRRRRRGGLGRRRTPARRMQTGLAGALRRAWAACARAGRRTCRRTSDDEQVEERIESLGFGTPPRLESYATQQQDWFSKCLQGGRALPLAAFVQSIPPRCWKPKPGWVWPRGMVLERGTNPKISRRTCTCEYGLQGATRLSGQAPSFVIQ